ncbi:alpha-amylase/4-alpha-glucanotransferase domain-containing protein [Candidatus Latescibacterota bacterium]
MKNKITFLVILHNHQPVGNFDWVFRGAAADAYVPFLDSLERHPNIKIGLHTTGPLLEWFDKNMPEYLMRLSSLVNEGRIEILGGAFYEPILSMLPDRDKTGQIEMMNRWIEKRFGAKPDGCWVAERIWEPYFAGIYGSCGLAYTALDNTHFQYAGLREEQIWGSYLTDDQGIPLRVLPIDYQLRYLIPFHEPQETLDYIGSLKDRGVRAVTYADDGEKFGVWPGTKKWVYDEGWLERFFTALDENAHWIDMVLPGDYVKNEPPIGRVYLPSASYREMTGWALPVEAQKAMNEAENTFEGDLRFEALKPFVRGGFWRNFLTKYSESNAMYRRMLMVSSEVESGRKKKTYGKAVRELYRAQCNCGYWHGVFGGLYLNFLRRAIYEHLIRAESLVSSMGASAEVTDFDGDGYDEVILKNDDLVLFVAPHLGGEILELDYTVKAFNIFDTMTRREELYHNLIPDSTDTTENEHTSIHNDVRSKEKGIRNYLHYDWYRRMNFIDHFILPDETLERFAASNYTELGDFVKKPYEMTEVEKSSGPEVCLERHGALRSEGRVIPVSVTKRFAIPLKGARLAVDYELEYGKEAGNFMFGVELNLGLQSGHADDSFVTIPGRELKEKHLASSGCEDDVREVMFTIGWMPLKITLSFSEPATLWRFPIETVSQSEGGVERNYQNSCIVPVWKLKGNDMHFKVELFLEVESW